MFTGGNEPYIPSGAAFTIAGVFKMVPSGRKWWQFWKPKMVKSDELRVFHTKGGTITVAPTLL